MIHIILLQDLVSSLEKKIDETEKKYEEASRLCEERLNQGLDAETKLIELKTSMQRFGDLRSFFSKMSITSFLCKRFELAL